MAKSKPNQQNTTMAPADPPKGRQELVTVTPPDLTMAPAMPATARVFLDGATGSQEQPKGVPIIRIDHKEGLFVLPSAELVESVAGFPILFYRTRKFYKDAYRVGEKGKPPDCWSADLVTPSPLARMKQAETCATCKWSLFESARDGRSQACSEITWNFLINPIFGTPPLAVLVTTPSSIRALHGTKVHQGYYAAAKAAHGAFQIVWTTFRLERAAQGSPHCIVVPEMGQACHSEEQARVLLELHNRCRDMMDAMRGETGSVPRGEGEE